MHLGVENCKNIDDLVINDDWIPNENDALYDILSIFSNGIEIELKKILFHKNYQLNLDINIKYMIVFIRI